MASQMGQKIGIEKKPRCKATTFAETMVAREKEREKATAAAHSTCEDPFANGGDCPKNIDFPRILCVLFAKQAIQNILRTHQTQSA